MARKRIRVEKQDVEAPDQFITLSHQIWSRISEHRKPLLILVLGILAAVAISITVAQFMESSASRATHLLAGGLEAREALVIGPGEKGPASRAELRTFPSLAARAEAAQTEFDKFLKNEKSSNVASFALLGKASSLADLGKHEEAAGLYREVLKGKVPDDLVEALAVDGLVYSLEALGKSDEALQEIEKATSQANGYAKDLLEYHLGMLYEKKGDSKKARDLYVGVFERLNSEKLAPGSSLFLKGSLGSRILAIDPAYQVAAPPRSLKDLAGELPPDVMKKLQEALAKKQGEKGAGGPGKTGAPGGASQTSPEPDGPKGAPAPSEDENGPEKEPVE